MLRPGVAHVTLELLLGMCVLAIRVGGGGGAVLCSGARPRVGSSLALSLAARSPPPPFPSKKTCNPHTFFPPQLAGTDHAPWLALLELFAYGTWADYKGKMRGVVEGRPGVCVEEKSFAILLIISYLSIICSLLARVFSG